MTDCSSAACTMALLPKKTKSALPVGGLRLNSVNREGVPAPIGQARPTARNACTISSIGRSPLGKWFEGRVLNSRRGETRMALGSTPAKRTIAARAWASAPDWIASKIASTASRAPSALASSAAFSSTRRSCPRALSKRSMISGTGPSEAAPATAAGSWSGSTNSAIDGIRPAGPPRVRVAGLRIAGPGADVSARTETVTRCMSFTPLRAAAHTS